MDADGASERPVCLITVVSGAVYERYADQLFRSAITHLRATAAEPVLLRLPGRPGWPDATIYRYHSVLEHQDRIPEGWVFLSDADMLFESAVGAEILPPVSMSPGRVTATLHPGYVGKTRVEFPYEQRPDSTCCIRSSEGSAYYCGGFVGGDRIGFLRLAERVAALVDEDARRGVVPVWHDESALNRVLASSPPDVTLTPAYCHPDQDELYRSWWPEDYERRLVALDKPASERQGRDIHKRRVPSRRRIVTSLSARWADRLTSD